MNSVYGYEGYQIYWLNAGFFRSNQYSYNTSFICGKPYQMGDNDCIRTIDPKSTQQADIAGSRSKSSIAELSWVKNKFCIPTEGQTLYFDRACTIPRIKCEGTWKRTIKPVKADVVVIPDIHSIQYYEQIALFINDQARHVVAYLISNNSNCPVPFVGLTLDEFVTLNSSLISRTAKEDSANRENLRKLGDAQCAYVGSAFHYSPKEQCIFDVIDGLYPRIVYESTLLQLLNRDDEKFTPEFVEGLIELLNSKDQESVHQGMRVLASMDYAHYPSIAKYILRETSSNWNNFKPFNSSVKFMLDTLGHRTYGFYSPFKQVTREEFTLAYDIFKSIVKQNIDETLEQIQKETNMVLSCTYDFDLTYPEPEQNSSLDSDSEDEDFDDE